ncbi:MAG TPA: hypothetical protein VLT58_17735, partial [Polyangia bacterium]|nr:hypothetical protein [Polyangia bacterium]
PSWGLILEFGMGGGGDDLVKVTYTNGSSDTLSAGDGVSIAAGVMVTPLWVGDGLGIGGSATIGYKYWSVGASNGDVSIGRMPMTLALHVLPRLSPRWFLFARGGIDKEVGVSVSSSGVASGLNASPEAGLGGFGEGGFYRIFDSPEQNGALSFTGRYTAMSYSANGVSVDASSFMLFMGLYYNP